MSFIDLALRLVEPGTTFTPHWSIQLLGEKLRRCHTGETKRLIVNMPPRCLKSFCASVALPAWSLVLRPASKIMCVAGGRALAGDQHEMTRRLMGHPRYLSLFPHKRGWRETDRGIRLPHGGHRAAHTVAPGSGLTGRGADLIVIDDPLPAAYADDEKRRARVNRWYDNNVLQRLDDKQRGVVIVVMQRVAHDDLTAHLLQRGGWEHVNLPAVAMADEHDPSVFGQRPMRRAGEALHPARESRAQLRELMLTIGAKPFMAQYQQQPYGPGEGDGHHGAIRPLSRDPAVDGSYLMRAPIFVNIAEEDLVLERVFGEPGLIDRRGPARPPTEREFEEMYNSSALEPIVEK